MTWLLLFPVAASTAVLSWLLNGLALRYWSRTAGLHWSERARRLYPVQVSAVWGLFLVAGCAGVVGHWVLGDQWNAPLIFGIAGFIGGLFGNYPPGRRCWPELTFRGYAASCLKSWGFFLGLVLAAPLLAWGMGPEWNARSAGVAGLFLGVYLWYVSFGWLWLMRRFRGVVAASLEIHALVREQASLRNIALKEVLFLEDFRALAFALPIQHTVLLTPKLVRSLTPEELRSVVDHELAHLGESRGVLAGRIVGSLSYAPLPFLGVAATWHGLSGIVACYVIWIVVTFIAKRLGKAMEIRADRCAVDRPEAGVIYARALEKIYAANLIPASGIARNQVHPDLYDRMLAAGVQPDFERPKKPDYVNWTFVVWVALVFGLLLVKASFNVFQP